MAESKSVPEVSFLNILCGYSIRILLVLEMVLLHRISIVAEK